MNVQPAPTDPRQIPPAEDGASYWLHVDATNKEWRLAKQWPKQSIFVQVRGSEETTVTFAIDSTDGILVPIPRGVGWAEIWPEQIKRRGTLVTWTRRRPGRPSRRQRGENQN